MRGLGAEGKRAAGDRNAYGESDPQAARETGTLAAAKPAKIIQPGTNTSIFADTSLKEQAKSPKVMKRAAEHITAHHKQFDRPQ